MTNLLTLACLIFISLESPRDSAAVNGDCVGSLQQRPVIVQEANRILGREEFTLADRSNETRAVCMWYIVTWHHARPSWSIRELALLQLLGPTGMHRRPLSPAALEYAQSAENLFNIKKGG
jgi:hypothetical protein